MDPAADRRAPISPQMALRVAVLGGAALILFAIVFFRLWYLQVLSGDQYLKQAQDNRVRIERVQAPRGAIVDRNGEVLVENRQATVLQIAPGRLPVAERSAALRWGQLAGLREKRAKGKKGDPIPIPKVTDPVLAERFRTLGRVLNLTPDEIQRRVVQSLVLASYAPITLKADVPDDVRNFILERSDDFPGVSVKRVFLRRYPEKTLAAQMLGTVGSIDRSELKQKRYRGATPGSIIGKDGLEAAYDRYLRGRDGATKILVDANGNFKGAAPGRDAQPGRQLRLSLDLDLQRTGQTALEKAIGAANANGHPADAGAFVAMDPRNGRILALGSAPSFDPNVLVKPITKKRFDALFGEQAGAPAFNRAIAAQYPTGSTFKPITAMAGLSEGLRTPSTPIFDSGCVEIGAAAQPFCNAGKTPNGSVNLRQALKVSSDVYFYTLGRDLNPLADEPLQHWARRMGLGRPTGIDLPGEIRGNVPDKAWRARVGRKEARYEKQTGKPCCTFSDKRPWTVGDNVNLSVGQGDLQATPLQMAVVYSTLANGGRVVRPHLGLDVRDSGGALLRRVPSGATRRVNFDPGYRQAIIEGLHAAASEPGGTSADVFKGWNQSAFPVYGKTGTAQTFPNGIEQDQSWYVAWVPDERRPIVIAVTVEKGGFGAEAAAPAARLMLARWFDQDLKFVAGSSHTR
jgi:penicillin-binding protein 2